MRRALAPVAALLIGVSILLTGQGLQGTLLPVRAGLEEFSTFAIGVMGGVYFFGFTLGCLKGGELVRNVGHIRVFAAMTAIASASPLAHGLVLNPWIWSLLRGLSGFCFAVLYVVIESWLNERADNKDRGIIFSTYVMITLTVTAAGQMMTLLYDPFDMHLFAITSVLVSIAAIPVVLSTSPSPEQPHQVEVNIRKLIRISPAGALGCLAHGLITGSFWSLAPVFTAGASDNVSLAAWFMTSAVIGGAVAQWPLGFLSDRIGRRKMMAAICLAEVALVVVLLTLMKESGVTGLVLFGAAWGFVAFPVYAIAVAHANDFAEADEYVMVSSGLLLMYGGGAIIGPFIASALMTVSGGSALFVFSGVIHLALAIYVITRIFRRESVPTEHHISFGDALATAHTASQVYDEEIQYHADEEEEDVPG
jgi:MFS family permease